MRCVESARRRGGAGGWRGGGRRRAGAGGGAEGGLRAKGGEERTCGGRMMRPWYMPPANAESAMVQRENEEESGRGGRVAASRWVCRRESAGVNSSRTEWAERNPPNKIASGLALTLGMWLSTCFIFAQSA
jgi:hypothetical protein